MDTEEDDMDTESTVDKTNQTRTGTPNKGSNKNMNLKKGVFSFRSTKK